MRINQLISLAIPALSPNDDAEYALDRIERVNTPQLPVVSDGQYLGMVSESVLLEADPETKVSDLPLYAQQASISVERHPFDLYRMAEENALDVVPVHLQDKTYAGSVLVADALRSLAKSFAFRHSGGILVLSVYERDYSINHISRLIESNNVKLLATVVDMDPDDAQRMLVTLKLNQTDLSRTVATLERFGIEVLEQFHQPETPDLDQERFDQLMRYLSI